MAKLDFSYRIFLIEAPYSTPKFIGYRKDILNAIFNKGFHYTPIIYEIERNRKIVKLNKNSLRRIAEQGYKNKEIGFFKYQKIKKLYNL